MAVLLQHTVCRTEQQYTEVLVTHVFRPDEDHKGLPWGGQIQAASVQHWTHEQHLIEIVSVDIGSNLCNIKFRIAESLGT
eukprot:scaffold198973_cov21-Tisochrysis_lutea.AAC.2